MVFSTDFGLPEYVSKPAPEMEASRVSLTATSAKAAPLSDTVAVCAWRDAALSLLAPDRLTSKFVTEPSTSMEEAPLDSSFRLWPEILLLVKLMAPFNLTSAREAL